MKGDVRVRVHPRMSVAKMAEYIEASPRRREDLLHDQKFPPTFQVIRYKDAFDVIRGALLGGDPVIDHLKTGALRVDRKPRSSKFSEQSAACSISAIEHFAKVYPTLGLDGVKATLSGRPGLVQHVEGVRISVHPAALLRQRVRGEDRIGALLPVFRKEQPLTERGGKAVAELLRGTLEGSGWAGTAVVHPALCLAVDVFAGLSYRASANRKRVLEEIQSACREIAIRWPFIPERAA